MSNIQLMNDLNALYQHKLLLPLKLQYKDYSEWMSHRDMTKHRQYWLSQFKDEVPILSYRQTMLDQILKRQMEQ